MFWPICIRISLDEQYKEIENWSHGGGGGGGA